MVQEVFLVIFLRVSESEPRSGEEAEKTYDFLGLESHFRAEGQDLTHGRFLVDIYINTQINLTGSFNWNYRGDCEDVSHHCSYEVNFI